MDLIQLADRMEHVHSDIRGELFHLANKMQREGTPVLKLNTGNPAAFGFPLPESIKNAIEGRAHEAVAYCDFQGMPAARDAIVRYEKSKGIEGIEPDDVFIGNGVSEVVNFALCLLFLFCFYFWYSSENPKSLPNEVLRFVCCNTRVFANDHLGLWNQ